MDRISIDKHILEKLWNGELYVSEQCVPLDETYGQLLKKTDRVHKELEKQLKEEILEQIEQYTDLLMEASEYRNQEAFKRGFSMAVSMVLEALQQEA